MDHWGRSHEVFYSFFCSSVRSFIHLFIDVCCVQQTLEGTLAKATCPLLWGSSSYSELRRTQPGSIVQSIKNGDKKGYYEVWRKTSLVLLEIIGWMQHRSDPWTTGTPVWELLGRCAVVKNMILGAASSPSPSRKCGTLAKLFNLDGVISSSVKRGYTITGLVKQVRDSRSSGPCRL